MRVGPVSIGTYDPAAESVSADAGGTQAATQVAVLKKALDAESDAAMKLISSLTGVGQRLDVKG